MFYDLLKRILDVGGAILFLGILSPVIILAAILVKITSDGPLLVEHSDRIGENNKLFRMYKFRSMIKNSHQLIRNDPKFKKLLEEYKSNSFKLGKDPRITAVGTFLRRFSIDELPQLFNVLKGDMSLIGPRAYYRDELDEQKKRYPFCKENISVALSVKPGMTGLWQVSGRSKIGFEKRVELDSNYAKSKSLVLDLVILLKTPWAVFAGEGVN